MYFKYCDIGLSIVDGRGTVRVRWGVNKVRSGISDSYQGTFRYTGPYPGYVPAVPRETLSAKVGGVPRVRHEA